MTVGQKPAQHVADVILPAEEHRQNADAPACFVDVEPVDRPVDGQVPEPRQNVVMALTLWGAVRMRFAPARTPMTRAAA